MPSERDKGKPASLQIYVKINSFFVFDRLFIKDIYLFVLNKIIYQKEYIFPSTAIRLPAAFRFGKLVYPDYLLYNQSENFFQKQTGSTVRLCLGGTVPVSLPRAAQGSA
ncbi:C4-dicarboxylate ABC transporter [Neisseria meningitidis]|uniref:C4-dicarboxylate ABC transporter n=1 Tax=Neisseria meningitidis TaxID=487 RepID=UPI001F00CC64|nr:C4-dicarboxylate ABC transporter [Neisseria meningitidis]